MTTLRLVLSFALRDLRSGFQPFRLLIVGTLVGVAAIASVIGVTDLLATGLKDGARVTVGGDISLRLFHQAPTTEELAFLRQFGTVSHTVEMRPSVVSPERQSALLVEVKAVDDVYPLYGDLRFVSRGKGGDPFAFRDGKFGAIVDLNLFERLGLGVGDNLTVAGVDFEVRGLIQYEPDRTFRAFSLGPRVMISQAAYTLMKIEGKGFPVYHYLRLRLDPGQQPSAVIQAIDTAFPDTPWRIVNASDGVPGIERTASMARSVLLFLSIGILLVSGAGMSRAVSAYVETKEPTISILRALGGSGVFLSGMILAQVLFATVIGIVGGLAVAMLIVALLYPVLAEAVALQGAMVTVPMAAFDLAAVIGLVCAVLFSLPALMRVNRMSPQRLLRDTVQSVRFAFTPCNVVPVLALLVVLWGIVAFAVESPLLAAVFVGLALGVVAVFGGLGRGTAWVAKALARRTRSPKVRLALAGIGRPGAATVPVVLSLGLGLTLITTVVTVQSAAQKHLSRSVPEVVADAFLINLDPFDGPHLEAALHNIDGVTRVKRLPFLHARVVAMKGRPIRAWDIPGSMKWVVRGDRGITWLDPSQSAQKLVEGQWWAPDYTGEPLISLDRSVAEKFGLRTGDTMTINTMGRVIRGRIANLREVDWSQLDLETPIIFNTAALSGVPHSEIMAVWTKRGLEKTFRAIDTETLRVSPLISVVRTEPILRFFAILLDKASGALGAISATVVLASLFVLAGSLASEHRRRLHESTIFKVLGASRRDLIVAGSIEFVILGAVSGVVAIVLGGAIGYGIVGRIAAESWGIPWDRVAVLIVGSGALTLAVGLGAALKAYSATAASVLRSP